MLEVCNQVTYQEDAVNVIEASAMMLVTALVFVPGMGRLARRDGVANVLVSTRPIERHSA